MTHLVHMTDGTKQVLTEEALLALPPETFEAVEPADRDRHITAVRLTPAETVEYLHLDRHTGDEFKFDTKADAVTSANTAKKETSQLMPLCEAHKASNPKLWAPNATSTPEDATPSVTP